MENNRRKRVGNNIFEFSDLSDEELCLIDLLLIRADLILAMEEVKDEIMRQYFKGNNNNNASN